jgi:hypothetical protein
VPGLKNSEGLLFSISVELPAGSQVFDPAVAVRPGSAKKLIKRKLRKKRLK